MGTASPMFKPVVALLPIAFAPLLLGAAFDTLPKGDPAPPASAHPLMFQPGTQPDENMLLEASGTCMQCHANYDPQVEPGFLWEGTMMAQASRDPLFWASLTVAGQDSKWAFGSTVAMDMCLRCHMPVGWLTGASEPTNGTALTGHHFEGVSCNMCHRMTDPFFEDTFAGIREGVDWEGYWDEATADSQDAAADTRLADADLASRIQTFSGADAFGEDNRYIHEGYTENSSGQYFVAKVTGPEDFVHIGMRGPFVDAQPPSHSFFYSRYHKSKFMCSTCHDVSNPALANLAHADAVAGDGTTTLPTEEKSAYEFAPVERTFSEFMASAFGAPEGAPGRATFAPEVFKTSRPMNNIASCQDCHMPDAVGKACDFEVLIRPTESEAHPKSGQPTHDLTGGNMLIPYILASTVEGSPNYDAVNVALLKQGPEDLTLDFNQGLPLNSSALLHAMRRAQSMLRRAANIEVVSFDKTTGALTFRVYNHTGHKLITGFPEGRRMFANILVYKDGAILEEINPYDYEVGTLRGLEHLTLPDNPPLLEGQRYLDELIYEAHPTSSITGEDQTFHFALATGLYKDNRIPPVGYDVTEAAKRQALPSVEGAFDADYFSAAEYENGYDEVTINVAPGADSVTLRLYYQTTSREYVGFLRDEINGQQNKTLPDEAYIVQTDPFFNQLKAWGDTIWELWENNKYVQGAAPVLMTLTSAPAGDVNGDGSYNAIDIQNVINGALGRDILPANGDLNFDWATNAVDVQLVINRALGLG